MVGDKEGVGTERKTEGAGEGTVWCLVENFFN